MRATPWGAALVLVALGLACTKTNPDYCAEAGAYSYSCSAARDAAAHDHHEVSPSGDATDTESSDVADASDGGADVLTDAGDTAERRPVCSSDPECAIMGDGGTPACDMSDGGARCVECLADTHCPAAKPVCDMVNQKCVECTGLSSNDCKGKSVSVCDKDTKTCVECLDDTKCTASATKPICDMKTFSCRPCALDSECTAAPGICVDWDGHCASPPEVVTLEGGASCVPSTGVYCRPNEAVAARPPNGVIVVKGPDPVGMIEFFQGSAGDKMLIVGRSGGLVAAGGGDLAGLHLGGVSKFYVRDLKVSGGTIGMLADGSGEAHITRCVVLLNPKGGIKISGPSFDITNNIVSGNGMGTDVGGVAWGGVRLGPIPAGGFARFDNNTVINNASIGVSCTNPLYDLSTSIVHGNSGGDNGGCAGVSCCGANNPDPKIDPTTLHLMSGSPCIGQIPATNSTVTVDIDLQPRPTPPTTVKLDCGADQFMP
jgi:hypothetical protein